MAARDHRSVALPLPRERVWAAIRRLDAAGEKRLTAWNVQDACKPMVRFNTVSVYMRGLARAGYLREVKPAKAVRGARLLPPEYELAKDSFDAPHLDVNGKASTQGLGRLAMWRAMQALKSFDHVAIAAAATLAPVVVSEITARLYVQSLAAAGYLQCLRPAAPKRPALYRLVKFTGPHAPAITRRKVVIDRNTGEIPWQETAQEVCDGLE